MCKILRTRQGCLPLFDRKNIQNQRGQAVYLGSRGRHWRNLAYNPRLLPSCLLLLLAPEEEVCRGSVLWVEGE